MSFFSDYRFTTIISLCLVVGCSATRLRAQTAQYGITFDATWHSSTHPYPNGAHFSTLIGATHNGDAEFWRAGGIATPGIERMAEAGSVSPLINEIQAAGDNAAVISGGALSSPGSTSFTFDAPLELPLVTLVTMVAPSPDWFVGVSGLNLREGGPWRHSVVVDLFAYDAGTDSGVDFTSPNLDTNPQEPIGLLGDPFTGTPPLGTFRFDLISVDSVSGDFDADGDYACADIDALVAQIAASTNSPAFDLTGDQVVNMDDLEHWLAEAGAAELDSGAPYLSGDANLNGVVDVSDFNLWNTHRFTDSPAWCQGDFNADGVVDVGDFNLWNAHRFLSADGGLASVPEPVTAVLLLGTLAGLGGLRRDARDHLVRSPKSNQ